MMNRTPVLSVVVPVFNEAGNAGPLFAEIDAVLRSIGEPYEIVFVNDGSTDATLAELRHCAAAAPALRILDLDGNFGEAAALCAGFRAARGEIVITLDGDGQNDPHDIPRLLDALRGGGYRVVSGWRQRRKEGVVLRVLPSRVANALIAWVTHIPVHDNGCGLKAYRRDVVATAALPRGMNRFMPAIFGVRTGEVAEVPVNDRSRRHGTSHYGVSRLLIVMRDVLAIRSIIGDPQRAQPRWRGATIGAVVAAGVLATRSRWMWMAAALAVAAGSGMVWWNLRRFNRAARDGVYRLRREYSAAPIATAAGAVA